MHALLLASDESLAPATVDQGVTTITTSIQGKENSRLILPVRPSVSGPGNTCPKVMVGYVFSPVFLMPEILRTGPSEAPVWANAPPRRQKGCFCCAPFIRIGKQHLYRSRDTIHMGQEKCRAAALALVGFWSLCGHSPFPYLWPIPIYPSSMYCTFWRTESFV